MERPAPVLPGPVGVAAGSAGLVGTFLALAWSGLVPFSFLDAVGLGSLHGADGLGPLQGLALGLALAVTVFGLSGLARGGVGRAWVLTLCGRYRGTVRGTGLLWVSPMMLRRRVDVRLRHWRSEPLPAVDAQGLGLKVTLLVVWRIRDTARALMSVDNHEAYLRECVEAAVARVFPRMPADTGSNAFGSGNPAGPTLRDAEAVGEELTRQVGEEAAPVGLEVFSVQAVRLEYVPEVAEALRRHQAQVFTEQYRERLLGSVLDSVQETVAGLGARGLVDLDDYERQSLVRDLTVAFCTNRPADPYQPLRQLRPAARPRPVPPAGSGTPTG